MEESESCEKLRLMRTRQRFCPYPAVATHPGDDTEEIILSFHSQQNLGLA